jgi:Spx/MgsR family transcriptional regulator
MFRIYGEELVMTLKFYGKKTCITCQKAKAYLEAQGVTFQEISIETQPPSRAVLESLVASNLKASLNSRSTIFKRENLGKHLSDIAKIIELMLEDPNLIKRPLLLKEDGSFYQGFDKPGFEAFIR